MEHPKYRVTPEELKQRRKTKPLQEVVDKQFGKLTYYRSDASAYFVDYTKVHTADLKTLFQNLSYGRSLRSYLKIPNAKVYERVAYLKEINDYVGHNFTEKEFDSLMNLIRNQEFLDREHEFALKLKAELDTRENIPNKKQKRIIRKLKATGKYVID